MITAEEEISNKIFWLARARARTAPSPGGGRLRHLSTKRFKNVFEGRAAIFDFRIFSARACILGFVRFYYFFVVASAKTHQKNPPNPHPPAILLFHMGTHACQIYRDLMKISSFENVFLTLVPACWCDLMLFSVFQNDDFYQAVVILDIFKVSILLNANDFG